MIKFINVQGLHFVLYVFNVDLLARDEFDFILLLCSSFELILDYFSVGQEDDNITQRSLNVFLMLLQLISLNGKE